MHFPCRMYPSKPRNNITEYVSRTRLSPMDLHLLFPDFFFINNMCDRHIYVTRLIIIPMKKIFRFLPLLLLPFITSPLHAQQPDAPLFGKDIIISDKPEEDQRNLVICSAPNGWLYAAYWCHVDTGFSFFINRSVDSGITWTEITNAHFISTWETIREMDILACGTDPSNIKVFLATVLVTDVEFEDQGAVLRINGITGEIEEDILQDQEFSRIHDISITTDYPHPAEGASPYSIGILYTKHVNWTQIEKVMFCASVNGGQSVDHRLELLSSTDRKYMNVDLAYAWSPAKNSGRYYAVWEDLAALGDMAGHIYTAHSEPNFNSPFTIPICLDSLNSSTINRGMNPVISCQADNVDNENLDITQVVLFEAIDEQTNKADLKGYYNKQSTGAGTFTEFSCTDPSHHNTQGDTEYNPFDHSFQITYFDSTLAQLPLLSNNYNLNDPDNWTVETPGYNDDDNIGRPYPKIRMNYLQEDGMNVWMAERTNGNRVAMFDAAYSTYTAQVDFKEPRMRLLNIIPNPTASMVSITLTVPEAQTLQISLFDNLGNQVHAVTEIVTQPGLFRHVIDCSRYTPGLYTCVVKLSGENLIEKLMIIR